MKNHIVFFSNRNLLKNLPEVYAHHERQEQEFIKVIGNHSIGILRRSKNGITKPLTLKAFREEIEASPVQLSFDFETLGGCGCFLNDYLFEHKKGSSIAEATLTKTFY